MINSKKYWEERFASGDWDDYDGNEQSRYFAQLETDAFPTWLNNELRNHNWFCADYGCAEGSGTALMAKLFPTCSFMGIDFSESAIKNATKKFPFCDFKTGNIYEQQESYDVVLSSNTLEHLEKPFEILTSLVKNAKKYAIIMLPFEADSGEKEHINIFTADKFPTFIGNHYLKFFKIIDCRELGSHFWKGKQLLLVYANKEYIEPDNYALGEIYTSNIEPYLNQAYEYYEEINELKEQLKEQERLHNIINQSNHDIVKLLQHCNELAQLRSFKLIHFISRFKNQFIKSDFEDKKKFTEWLLGHKDKQFVDLNHEFNPFYQVIKPLEQIRKLLATTIAKQNVFKLDSDNFSITAANAQEEIKTLPEILKDKYNKFDVIIFSVIDYDFRYQRPQQIANHFVRQGHRVFYVNANFMKDAKTTISIKNSGMLFQINLHNRIHNNIYSVNSVDDTRQIIKEIEEIITFYAIRDGLIIADYPNWFKTIKHLKHKFGYHVITDYMDDFTGFTATALPFVKTNCVSLLKESDAVVASSTYLENIVTRYNTNVSLIRNGTEFKHFFAASIKNNGNKKKVIGYYGAIAEWFDADKVMYIAENMPECDVVLIGDITNKKIRECSLPNMIKLGEIPYAELPKQLVTFDVCLIPFDTSTSLIKATNPVKFYEYLSAGKKIVATEIPELESYKDKFAYLTNDKDEFLNKIKLCLDKKDILASKDECYDFAKNNDWEVRTANFEKAATAIFPRISIVILCYNQLEYTRKCVESILDTTAYPNYEIVLVDNCSEDGTKEYLQELAVKFTNVKIVFNDDNRGFAGGNNDGIKCAGGDYIVLLNNDTIVTRGWLTDLVKWFKSIPEVGLVGPVTNSIGNEAQIDLEYENIDNMPILAYEYTSTHMNKDYKHDGVLAMFCLMISRKVIDTVGLLDENYGVGMFEDDDYSKAAQKAGYKLILAEDAFVHHFGSVSFKKLENKKHRELFEKNEKYFEKKWNVKWEKHHYRNF